MIVEKANTVTSHGHNGLITAAGMMLFVATAVLLTLNYAKLVALFTSQVVAAQQVAARTVAKATTGNAAHMQVAMAEQAAEQGLRLDANTLGVTVLTRSGEVLTSTGTCDAHLIGQVVRRLFADQDAFVSRGNLGAVAVRIDREWRGEPVAVAMVFSLVSIKPLATHSFKMLAPVAVTVLVLAWLVLTLLGPHICGLDVVQPDIRSRQVTVFVGGLLLAINAAVGVGAYSAFERAVRGDDPGIVQAGAPQTLDSKSVQKWLSDRFGSGTVSATTVIEQSKPAPELTSAEGLQSKLRSIFIESLLVMVIGSVLIYEGVLAFLSHRFEGGADQGVQRLRLPFFMFVFGVELTRPLSPLWAKMLACTGSSDNAVLMVMPGLPLTLHAQQRMLLGSALPLMAMLLSIAAASPLTARALQQWGGRVVFSGGVLAALFGLVVAATGESLAALVAGNAAIGLGYAAVFATAQGCIAGHEHGRNVYLGACVAGAVAGMGLGSIMADRLGFESAYVLGSICMMVALLYAHRLPSTPVPMLYCKGRIGVVMRRLAGRTRFQRVLLQVTLPMQVLQHGIVFLWLPIAAVETGNVVPTLTMGMMSFFIIAHVVHNRAAQWLHALPHSLMTTGLALALLGAVIAYAFWSPIAIVVASALFGASWSVTFAPLGVLIADVHRQAYGQTQGGRTTQVYRETERLLIVIAPVLMLVCMLCWGSRLAIVAISVMFVIAMIASTRPKWWLRRSQTPVD